MIRIRCECKGCLHNLQMYCNLIKITINSQGYCKELKGEG